MNYEFCVQIDNITIHREIFAQHCYLDEGNAKLWLGLKKPPSNLAAISVASHKGHIIGWAAKVGSSVQTFVRPEYRSRGLSCALRALIGDKPKSRPHSMKPVCLPW